MYIVDDVSFKTSSKQKQINRQVVYIHCGYCEKVEICFINYFYGVEYILVDPGSQIL